MDGQGGQHARAHRTFEGWPSYHLEPAGEGETRVRHRATLAAYGGWGLASPVLRRLALKERTTTIDALKASFERNPTSGADARI